VGVVKERETDKTLQANVKLYGSDGTIEEQQSKKNGEFQFELDKATDYRVVTTKKGYLKGNGRETTRGLDESQTLRMTITMASIDKPIELPNILYDLNSAELRPESMVALDELVNTLNENPKITIELAAHTDFRDSEEYNQDLSQRRAQSVVDYLIKNGIDPERLTAKGYGESRPKEVTASLAEQYDFLPEGQVLDEEFIRALPNEEQKEEAHQINRRTEFRVLSTDYNPKN
jgi:peptidoglycan-associated lipoprotein